MRTIPPAAGKLRFGAPGLIPRATMFRPPFAAGEGKDRRQRRTGGGQEQRKGQEEVQEQRRTGAEEDRSTGGQEGGQVAEEDRSTGGRRALREVHSAGGGRVSLRPPESA